MTEYRDKKHNKKIKKKENMEEREQNCIHSYVHQWYMYNTSQDNDLTTMS